jgi:Cytosine deaminase and related metal-dependent hydrolases
VKILSADYVLPISSRPIEDGAVATEDSFIAAVGSRNDLIQKFPDAEHEDFGEAAILPGFVNCHSHLEITAMRGFLDSFEHDFRSWLLKLNTIRAEKLTNEDIEIAAIAGAIEGVRAGVTCFGDIGRYGKAGLEALKAVGLRGVLFQETEFSPDNRTADDDFEKLKEKFFAMRGKETKLVAVGISPHSPYTVSRRLFERIGEFALAENIKLSIHAAESTEEDELVRKGSGFFIDVYKKFGVEWDVPQCSPVDFLSQTGVLQAKPLLVHCVTASGGDIDLIAQTGSRIAHCPKSNAKFGHGYAPLEQFLDAGIAVGIGSDSVASNNTCDMLEESCFAALAARNRPGRRRFVTAAEVLEAATLGGAKALGLNSEIGTIETGKQADIIVISLANIAQQPVNDIHAALVFASNARDVVMTIVAGKEIFRDGKPNSSDEAEIKNALIDIRAKLS